MRKAGAYEIQADNDGPRIFLIGLTSAKLGNMESGNLGNYMIIEPLIARLKNEFPDSQIRTSIQLSDAFCERFDIASLHNKRFWSYGRKAAFETMTDIVRLSLWHLLRPFLGARVNPLIEGSDLLREIHSADLVIDFSGDIFGDNAPFNKFLEGCAEILFARALDKPVIMSASSPGPFSGWRKPLARFVLNRVSLITNREPLSTELLIQLGVSKPPSKDTACPAFLFEGKTKDQIQDILEEERIDPDRPTVGIILSGWNMPESPYDRVPRQDWELIPFIKLTKFLLDEVRAQVVLISHSHRSGDDGQLAFGPDKIIIEQIYERVRSDDYEDSLILLSRPYDAATTKGLVGVVDLLISGRLHGAISGLSQGVPTVMIDYGHEPKAHKLRGVARQLDIQEYLCDPSDSSGMIHTVASAWSRRYDIRAHLSTKIEEIENLAVDNIKVLHRFI